MALWGFGQGCRGELQGGGFQALLQQHKARQKSCQSSAKHKSRDAPLVQLPHIDAGQKVYVKSDLNKSKARDPYVVISVDKSREEATLQKLLPKNNKKNLVTAQLQNIFPVSKPSIEPQPSFSTSPVSSSFLPEKSEKECCFYCKSSKKRNIHHSPKLCTELRKANPSYFFSPAVENLSSDSEPDLEETTPVLPFPNPVAVPIPATSPASSIEYDLDLDFHGFSDEDNTSEASENLNFFGDVILDADSSLSQPPSPTLEADHNQRLVLPGDRIYFKSKEDPDTFIQAIVTKMVKSVISMYPTWYNIKTLWKGKWVTSSIELLPHEKGSLWDIDNEDPDELD